MTLIKQLSETFVMTFIRQNQQHIATATAKFARNTIDFTNYDYKNECEMPCSKIGPVSRD